MWGLRNVLYDYTASEKIPESVQAARHCQRDAAAGTREAAVVATRATTGTCEEELCLLPGTNVSSPTTLPDTPRP